MRIEDGGGIAKNQQYGDFFYWDYDGFDWLIECKATREKSFPIANLRAEQMAKLKTYQEVSAHHRSVIAINFYGQNLKEVNDCILINYTAYEHLVKAALEAGRASIPRKWLEECGRLQKRVQGGLWALDFGGLA